MEIEDQFINYITQNQLFSQKDRLLATVSGGADSVFLVTLLKKINFNFAIAHVNFQLRDEDSNQDQIFVQNLATKLQVNFYTTNFNTTEYAQQTGDSIEMAARHLRYKWFDEIKIMHNYDYILTAHHADDNVETYLLNIIRGTGLRGIQGIANKRQYIVRPILFTNKEEILTYLQLNNIDYRTDLSNFENNYHRNKIRNIIIPEMQKINSAVKNNILKNIKINNEVQQIYNEAINSKQQKCFIYEANEIKIKISKLIKLSPLKTYLFEFLKPYNFNYQTIEDIISGLQEKSGKIFLSESHKILRDREFLLIKENIQSPINQSINELIINNFDNQIILNPGLTDALILNANLIDITADKLNIQSAKHLAYIDFHKIKFPLRLRKWRHGDFFYPIGMNKRKKISDFFSDNKISSFEKEKIWILEDDQKIIWIINHRLDNRVKITATTTKCLILQTNNE